MNQTRVAEFLLLGLQNVPVLSRVPVALFTLTYILAVTMNSLIIVLVAMVPGLRSPMYFFLSQLSLSDILLTSNTVPNMLHVMINGGGRISFTGCITQLFFHGVSSASESLLLMVMSYDRYVAISKPLHYTSIMSPKLCILLVSCSWSIAWLATTGIVTLVCSLPYCGPQVIDHYFCDIAPVLTLSCSDHTVVDRAYFLLALHFNMIPFSFILFTYISIFSTIFGISSAAGKQKAFSTCSTHLIVVSTYYGTIIAVYAVPSNRLSLSVSKVISLLYTMGIPLFNPIIYSLRNQEIKKVILKSVLRNGLTRNHISNWEWQKRNCRRIVKMQ